MRPVTSSTNQEFVSKYIHLFIQEPITGVSNDTPARGICSLNQTRRAKRQEYCPSQIHPSVKHTTGGVVSSKPRTRVSTSPEEHPQAAWYHSKHPTPF